MPFEYEALVGHLYVVGGRSISAAPPGTLVEVAPKKAARGRETDTFFVMVLPSGETVAPAAFYEQMSRLSAEKYFLSTGSVTAGLRTVFNTLNENLYEHNQTGSATGVHYEASILCAVLRSTDLYLAKVGSGVAVFRHEGEVQPFPADFSNDEALFSAPLGVQPAPDVKMAHYQVQTGTRLILSDPGLADLTLEQIETAIEAENIGEVLLSLRALVARQIILTAVEFVPSEAPVEIPVREGESTAALNTPRPAVEPDKPKRSRRVSPVEVPARTTLSKSAFGLGRLMTLLGGFLDVIMPQPKEDGRSFWSTPLVAGLTVVIPLVVVVLVLVLWVGGTGKSAFEICYEEAVAAGATARSIASSDVPGTIAGWNAVIEVVERCNEIREGDVALQALTVEAQQIIDRLLQIDRRAPMPITSFPDAGLKRVVLQGDDLYVLDDRNDLVYRVKLTADGRGIVPGSQQPIQSMRRNASVEAFTVGDLLDIAWAEDSAGLSQGNVLLALDRSGVLVECSPRFLESLECDAQQLINTDTWQTPIAMALWQSRLYILDPGANQLWRYEPGPGAFTNAPTEYFIGDARPDLRNAVDFAIDDTGYVYILLSDGVIIRFRSGEAQPFGYASFPEHLQITTAHAMFLNRNPIAQGLMIINQSNRTIYETTLAGTFIASYRAQDEAMFASIADVVVDDNLSMVYALSGNSVLGFERTVQPTQPQE
jgi:hypothetical protein